MSDQGSVIKVEACLAGGTVNRPLLSGTGVAVKSPLCCGGCAPPKGWGFESLTMRLPGNLPKGRGRHMESPVTHRWILILMWEEKRALCG